MGEHSPTPWRDALARLHHGAMCEAARWHMSADRADKDRDVIANCHTEMVEALNDARLQIEYLHEKFAETGSGNTALAKIRSALAKASQTQTGSRMGEPAFGTWMPIGSAPKDGQPFIGCHHLSGVRQITWFGKTSHIPLYGWAHGEDVEEIDLWEPTHWMPLPAPPTTRTAPVGEEGRE